MGKNNNAIQNLRGTRKAIVETSETLLPGQLLYNMTDNYITAGKAAADGSPEETPANSAPITVRELHGWTGDADGIADENSKGNEFGIKYVEGSGLSVISADEISMYSKVSTNAENPYPDPENSYWTKVKVGDNITLKTTSGDITLKDTKNSGAINLHSNGLNGAIDLKAYNIVLAADRYRIKFNGSAGIEIGKYDAVGDPISKIILNDDGITIQADDITFNDETKTILSAAKEWSTADVGNFTITPGTWQVCFKYDLHTIFNFGLIYHSESDVTYATYIDYTSNDGQLTLYRAHIDILGTVTLYKIKEGSSTLVSDGTWQYRRID